RRLGFERAWVPRVPDAAVRVGRCRRAGEPGLRGRAVAGRAPRLRLQREASDRGVQLQGRAGVLRPTPDLRNRAAHPPGGGAALWRRLNRARWRLLGRRAARLAPMWLVA